MKRISRNLLAGTAATSMILLAGCGGQGVEDVPALSEIDDLMWETMQEEGSVTITADVEMFGNTENTEMFSNASGEEGLSATIYGPLDGSATAIGFGDNDLMRAFGQDEAYMAGDGLFELIGAQDLSDAEQQQFDAATEEFADTWIDLSEDFSDDAVEFKISEIFATLQDGWNGEEDEEDTVITRDDISDEGTHEVRDDIDVWVYEGQTEGQELVLIADHDAPRFYEISDDGQNMKFSKWGETESPERPEESQTISQDEAQQRMMEVIFG